MESNFGHQLREARQGADMTMGELVRVLGVSVTYISDVERGNRAPLTKDNILKAAAAMKIDPSRLLAAAAESKGAFELEADHLSDAGREVGAYLSREWRTMTDDDFNALREFFKGRGGRGERW
jgi:transcriptional regulator with XRE-family HTH domain